LNSARRTLAALAAVTVLPVAVAIVSFYYFPPEARMNYGTLIPPRPLPRALLPRQDGGHLTLDELRGRWVMLTADASACDDRCRRKLYVMRQVRAAQGVEGMGRIERVWLLTGEGRPAPALLADFPGIRVAGAAMDLIAALPGDPDPADHIFLIDPLGNLMLRFPADPDPGRMIEDLKRLLKVSRIG
jgi:cytochrome oxidase Cu insertion factor (SCO1/SenC/PrrC family)